MLTLVVALCAAQVDAGPQPDAGPPPSVCGSLSDQGACFNDQAAFCSEDNDDGSASGAELLVEDCRGGHCALVDGLGAWCFADEGAPCAFGAGERATAHACGPPGPVADPAWACDLVEGCVALNTTGCGEGCVDEARLRVGCAPFGQALTLSCAALGGTCAGAACGGLRAGAPCDERLACAPELRCVAGACAASSAGARVDAGPAEPPPTPAPAPLCGQGAPPAALALALSLLTRQRIRRLGGRPPQRRPDRKS